MGIEYLHKYLQQYANENRINTSKIRSSICYIDCTSKIYSFFFNQSRYERNIENIKELNNVYEVIDQILDSLAKSLIIQIKDNKYYNKYILLFDHYYLENNKKISLDPFLINYYQNEIETSPYNKKERVSAIPLIPNNINIYEIQLCDLLELVRTSSEVRWSYWNFKTKNITNYVSVYYLLNKTVDSYKLTYNSDIINDFKKIYCCKAFKRLCSSHGVTIDEHDKYEYKLEKTILSPSAIEMIKDKKRLNEIIAYLKLKKIINNNFQLYLVHRGIKRFGSKNKKNTAIDKIKDDYLSDEVDDPTFSQRFIKKCFDIQPQLIISLIPNLIYKIQEGLKGSNKDVEFLGCEEEADYVIYQHIKKYRYENQCPTIVTNDTDMLLLLHDIDCIIKIKQCCTKSSKKKTNNVKSMSTLTSYNPHSKLNCNAKDKLIIYPKKFWSWLLKRNVIKYENLVALCARLGTTYNHYKSRFKINSLNDIRKSYTNSLYFDTICEIKNDLKRIENEKKSEDMKRVTPLLQMLGTIELYLQLPSLEQSFHNIKPIGLLEVDKINQRYFDIFTQLILR